MIEFALILAASGMDRLRGSSYGFGKTPELLVYGWVIAALLGHPLDGLTAPIAVLFAFGGTFGWGEPIGAALGRRLMTGNNLESWQVGPLKHNTWLALCFRGFLWGAPALVLYPFLPTVVLIAIAYTIAMPGAVLIAMRVLPKQNKWELQEILRGVIAASIISLGVNYGL